jgi:hypothetical protein
MSRPDEGLIHAWLDGELAPDEAARVERLVAEDAEWGAAAAEARGLVAASSRILMSLDQVPSGVMPAGSRAAPARKRFAVRPWMRAAAGVALVAGTAYVVTEQAGAPELDTVPSVVMMSDRAAEPDVISERSQPVVSAPTPPSVSEPRVSAPRPTTVTSQSLERERSEVANAAAAAAPVAADVARERATELASGGAVGSAVGAAGSSVAAAGSAAGAAMAAPPPAAAPPPEARRDAIMAEAERRAAPLRARREATLPQAQGFAAKALSVNVLDGCWRSTTSAGADSVLVTPTIVEARGDTLVLIAGVVTRPATVVREGNDRLRGEMVNAVGTRVPFAATRIACPAAQPPDAAPTPSPRR